MQVFLSIDFGEGEMASQYGISQIINNPSVSIGLLGNSLSATLPKWDEFMYEAQSTYMSLSTKQ